MIFFFVLGNMGHDGSENFKTLPLLQSQPNVFKLTLNFPPNGDHKNAFVIFLNFVFPIFNDFFPKFFNSPL